MDRDVEISPSGMTFETASLERLFATPVMPSPVARRRFGAVLIACLLIHVGGFAVLFYKNGFFPAVVPAEQEIPVELVAEPPPDEAAPPPSQPAPPKVENTLDEKPAFDAPRTANNETIDREAPDEVTQSPHVAPPSKQIAPTPVPDAQPSAPQEAASQTAPEPSTAVVTDNKPDAEIEAKRDELEKTETRAPMQAQPEKGAKSVAELLANLESLPDYKIAGAAKRSPVGGGQADSRYFTILWGLINNHFHPPPRGEGDPLRTEGEIAFNVDGKGKVTYLQVIHPSGVQELDTATVWAIRQASPFPAPPGGLPLGLTFTYHAAQ